MNSLVTCDPVEKFPVVMLYDHFSSVPVAMATYTHLTRELESDFEPELRAWRMDAATSAEFSVQAGKDIAEAEVIILTVRGDQPWPAAFRHWKAGSGGVTAAPHAVVVLLEADENAPIASAWKNVLSATATQIDGEVFVYEDEAAADGRGLVPT